MNNESSFGATLGKRIREIRNSAGLALDDLEAIAGVSKTYLSDIETGKADNPSVTVINKIAQAFNMSITELLEGIEPEQSFDLNNLDGLAEATEKDKTLFKRTILLVKVGLSGESKSIDKRRKFARIIVSLVKLFFR